MNLLYPVNETRKTVQNKKSSINSNNFKDKKALTSSSNSLGSNTHSEDPSSTSGLGRELRRKIIAKNSMTKKYILPIKQLKLNMSIFIGLGEMLGSNMNIPGSMKIIAYNIRQLSYNLILNNTKNYFQNTGALNCMTDFLIEDNLDSVSQYMNIPTSSSLMIPVGKYSYDSFEQLTLSDSYKKFLSNVKYCINRVNSKGNFDSVFSVCKNVLSDEIIDSFGIIRIIIVSLEVVLVIITLLIAYIKHYEVIITDYEEKIETLCESYEIDKEITESTRNEKKKSNNTIILIISFAIIIIYVIISGIPILTAMSDEEDILAAAQKSIDRFTIIKSIQLFTYEVINQDRSIFIDYEPQRILDDYITRIETIQEELKSGSYGGPTFDSFPFLDNVLKEGGCFRDKRYMDDCERIEYDNSYGFSEEVGTLPVNELIREYIFNVKNFLNDFDNGKYVTNTFTSKENIEILYEQFTEDKFFKLQEKLVDNIVGDIQYINQEIIDYSQSLLDDKSEELILLIALGILIFLIIAFLVLNKIYSEKIRDMNSLVSFLFLVPATVVNKNEKFKRFLETTQTDD
ncbi:hypothetical protein PIROE2DRAFT_18237 [Piromyces sp. E2]|nr:hypothetical protein PIROE2DRAFT_18237 [Piromyces sp. E2]|eukprot:OUM56941.1 hypothetical protein PIROE2DRAFT_18237 [Piromyces sp. E2]